MLIRKIILYKFKRFFLSGVDKFVYAPERNITLMCWRNGMGKSSFLSQVSPLPADLKKDYDEGGYKYIHIQHKDKDYIISSGYTAPNKHSFIVNDEELNTLGNVTLQKQLAEEHFGISQDILDILLDKTPFCSMGINTRKFWFSKLSPIDYKYSINIYNEIKTNLRDNLGGIKILNNDLNKINQNKLPSEDIKKLEEEAKLLNNQISELSQYIDTRVINPVNVNIENSIKRLDSNNEILKSLSIDNNYLSITKTEVKERLLLLKNDISNNNNILKELYDKIRDIEKIGINLDKSLLEKEKEEILGIIEKDNSNYNYDLLESDIMLCNTELPKIKDLITKLESPEIKNAYTGEKLNKIENKIISYQNEEYRLKLEKDSISFKIKELEQLIKNPNLCPKCGYNSCEDHTIELNKLNNRVIEIDKSLELINTKLKTLTKLKLDGENKIYLLSQLSSALSYGIFKEILLPYLKDKGISSLSTGVNMLLTTLKERKEIKNKITRLKDIEHKLQIIKTAEETKEKYGEVTIKSLEKDIEKYTEIKNKQLLEHNTLLKVLDIKEDMFSIAKDIENYKKYIWEIFDKSITDEKNRILKEGIGILKLKLDSINNKILDSKNLENTILDYNTKIENMKNDNELYDKMLEILSPESGLIAMSINSFLNVFLKEMNELINSVWSYNMELLPCEIDNNDLNYKFRVLVNYEETIEDISKLSSSMQEIVNLAFKIVFTKYLNIVHFPLVLDEYTKTMDEEHRIAAYDVVSKVLAYNYKHIFIVSHYESVYSRFANVDFLELKESEDE